MASCCPKDVESWTREQIELKKRLVTKDDVDWKGSESDFEALRLIGGVDISFHIKDDKHACPCLVVLSFPDLKVVHKQKLMLVHIKQPYVPEFLAFREVLLLQECIDNLKSKHPKLMPQVIIVDGNGMLHTRGFGIACHLGVLTGIPTIGVAKNLFHVDGIKKGKVHTKKIQDLKCKGDSFPLVGKSGVTWGMALRTSKPCTEDNVCKPIYVSVGHRIGLETAVKLVQSCCSVRIPEPTRQADILSREYLREHYTEDLAKCSCNTTTE